MGYLITLLIWAVICGLVGMAIGDLGGKKNGALGGLLGALLGPIGWIIVAVSPPKNDGESSVQPTGNGEQDRIAKLEAELASLKATNRKPATPALGKDLNDDGGIPTYKLD